MKVSDLLRRLSLNELSNLAMSGDGSGAIIESKHPLIIQLANEGLLKIFSRFILRENDLLIEQVEQVTNYHLRREYAESADANVPYPYIKDLPDEPFQGDVIRILAVQGLEGTRYVLNDENYPGSLFTPQPDVLQLPWPVPGQPLVVLYQARHPVLSDNITGYLEQEIELPFSLEGALTSYIAHKVFSNMSTQEALLKSQEQLGIYDGICGDIEVRDLVNQTFVTTNTKLEQRGFK